MFGISESDSRPGISSRRISPSTIYVRALVYSYSIRLISGSQP